MTGPVTRLTVEYDGREFGGWATQPGLRTVQEELERALAVLLGRPATLAVAGRTDRGVHARAQVASYAGEPVAVDGLNALIGPDVAVLAAEAAAEDFDARRSATSRAYCYRVVARRQRSAIERGRALHWPHDCDRALLDACAAALLGTRTFTAFTPTETDHVRFRRDVFIARWRATGDILEFWVEADSFLRNMNRALVGTMLQVAGGRRTLDSFVDLLAGAHRREAGPTAAPDGLYLVGVGYGRRVLDPAPG